MATFFSRMHDNPFKDLSRVRRYALIAALVALGIVALNFTRGAIRFILGFSTVTAVMVVYFSLFCADMATYIDAYDNDEELSRWKWGMPTTVIVVLISCLVLGLLLLAGVVVLLIKLYTLVRAVVGH